jgi:hypothetical protein
MGYRISNRQITYREPLTQVRLPTGRGFEETNIYATRTRRGYETRQESRATYERKKDSIGDYAQGGGTPNSLTACAGGKVAFI